MNSNRVYRGARDKAFIIDQLRQGDGSQFDPEFAEVFLKLIEEGKIEFNQTTS